MTAAGLLEGLSRATVLAAMSPQLPDGLVRAVLTEARRREIETTLLVADLTGEWDFLDARAEADLLDGRLRVVVLAGSVPRRLAARVEQLPVSLFEADRLIASGALHADVLLARAGRTPSGAGTMGNSIGYTSSALARTMRVGFEVAPVQTVPPGTAVDLSAAELLIETTAAAATEPTATGTFAQHRIADLTAGLVPDGATIQLGLGVVPALVAARLTERHHLGLHSGILPAAARSLIASGAVTGHRKVRDVGRHVATGLMGAGTWSSDVLLQPISRTHDPGILAAHEHLWALNSAYQVDLAGQVNSEYVGDLRLSSGGGLIDFARAAHSGAGASVISLPSRTADGSPRIVPRLDCFVTIPGTDVDAVVTEYGVAHLAGRTAYERAAALVQIAHPEDRSSLLTSLPAHERTAG